MNLDFLKSYRIRIILSFLTIIILTLVLMFSYYSIDKRTKELQTYSKNLSRLTSSFSENNQNLQSFILFGYKSPELYTKNKELYIDEFINNSKHINKELVLFCDELANVKIDLKLELEPTKKKIDTLITYVTQFKELKRAFGYKDFGEIGIMRDLAHKIEDESKFIKKADILMLRRHEKDFLLRADLDYVVKFNRLANTKIFKSNLPDAERQTLKNYQQSFNKIVNLSFTTGNDLDSGLYVDIETLQKTIYARLIKAENVLNSIISEKNDRITNISQLSTVIGMLFISIIVLYFSGELTKDLRRLYLRIHKFIASDFKEEQDVDINDTSSILEVDKLYRSFNLLKTNLLSNINGLNLTIKELEELTNYKSSFLANMSHEIRTPLNGVTGMLSLLKQGRLNEQQKEYIDIAEYSSSHLLQLINSILDYSKINAGKLVLENIPMDVESDLDKLTKIFHFQTEDKNIDLIYNFNQQSEGKFVLGDPVRLHQVLINLINNAIKFTEDGTVTITIEQTRLDDTYDSIYFEVEDTGIGMDEHQIKKIFEAFEQADLSTTRQYGGTGLGLTISYDLVKLMGSELYIKAKKDIGSKFYFTLKFKRTDKTSNKKKTIARRIEPKTKKPKGLKILVVEDNAMNQKIMELMLKNRCSRIDFANNGQEAVDLFLNNRYDIIFMDLHMPVMDGYEATKTIKATDLYLKTKPPIVAVSANAYKEDMAKADEAGVDDYLSKPVELNRLKDLLIKYS